MPKTLRKQLPLSYAAIALLTVLALGAVLMVTLRGYYTRQEREYLSSNAIAISEILSPMIGDEGNKAVMLNNLNSFSLLSQTHIRLLDADKQLIAESAANRVLQIAIDSLPISAAVPERMPSGERISQTIITIRRGSADFVLAPREKELVAIEPGNIFTGIFSGTVHPDVTFFRAIPVAGDTGNYFDSPILDDNDHSNQVVSEPLYDTAGKLSGYVELSQGPALGKEILTSVFRGWAIAGLVAIFLAVGIGLLVSQQISAPLLALTGVTSQMAAGNLAVRAGIFRQGEIGDLGRAFNKMASRVETTVCTLQQFVADAAHALNTPLTALRTNLEIAADEKNKKKLAESIERAQTQVERLQVLTRGLLDLSRLEANGTKSVRERLDLTVLVNESSELYASRAEQSGILFSLDTPNDPVEISGSAVQLRQAIGNLMDNAIKFTSQGGHIQVHLMQGINQAALEITNTGVGIPEDDLPRLFTRFHRGSNAAPYPGSGLGLAIVQVIVHSHHGKVFAENTGQGARFVVQLPLFVNDRPD